MGWQNIKFSCGHTEYRRVDGRNRREKEEKIAFFERYGECSECYKKRKQEERGKAHTEANARAQAKMEELSLPALEGSEKQAAWANTIRVQKFEDLEELQASNQRHLDWLNGDGEHINEDTKEPMTEEDLRAEIEGTQKSIKVVDYFEKYLRSQTKSTFWIDNKDELIDYMAENWFTNILKATTLDESLAKLEQEEKL